MEDKNAVIYDRFAHIVEDIKVKFRIKLMRYFAEYKGYNVKNNFIDNGYSGCNFYIPGFKETMTYIKK